MASKRIRFSEMLLESTKLVHPMSPRVLEEYVLALVSDRRMPLALWLAETMADRALTSEGRDTWHTWFGMWRVLLAYVPTAQRLKPQTTMQARIEREGRKYLDAAHTSESA